MDRCPEARFVIPTEYEWYKAAYHKNDGASGNYFDYPTSSDVAPGHVIDDPDTGNNANHRINSNTVPLSSPYWRTEVGEFENTSSPYGAYDMAGNVYELTEGVYQRTYDKAFIVRGGTQEYYTSGGLASTRLPIMFDHGDRYTGFRVVMIPEPATMSLLALGGLAVLKRRKS